MLTYKTCYYNDGLYESKDSYFFSDTSITKLFLFTN
jgi:hypothetical protein